ncbi:DNA mismatch repair protein MutS [Paenibacillus sp. MMS18-CY102]|uniref:DNA mismatch repair protein MutS n=1 Tax=Paenibacillus sp. MMS18-CY102 TaxID=2682849 RepID=UPI00136604AD|nr:DNA mismatch repair protein MutS [Paenibacillus sp. MMS18-CY102]MWC28162.1 DNA mismatch repair protein MutS [Paenibacillus sp. MMS18-CY102]
MAPTYTPMMQQYLSIKEQAKDAFLLFRLGDFYEMFFDDAVLASRELEITLTGREAGGAERIPMCGVPYHSAENYIARLIEKGYKVAICEQVEDPAAAKGVVRREIVRVVTPGTVMESKSLADKANNFIVGVAEQEGRIGFAACDLSTGELYVTSFAMGGVEAVLDEINVYHPAEIVGDESLLEQLKAYAASWPRPIVLTPREPMALSGVVEQFGEQPLQGLEQERLLVIATLTGYLADTQKRSFGHVRTIRRYEPNQYMILDPFTRRNLELTETVRDRSKKGSLLWLLDRTQTSMGARLLRRWVDKPLLSVVAIEERLSAVSALFRDLILRDDVRRELSEIYDLERLVGRVAFGSANGRDLNALKLSLRRVPALAALCASSGDATLQALFDALDECSDIADAIERVIVDEPPVSVREGGLIRSGTDEYLDRLREASTDGKRWLAELERSEREATGIKSLKIGYNKVFGYYLEVSKANIAGLPEGRYERKQTLANAERYVTPELKEKERLILEAEEKMVDLEYEQFVQLREQIAGQLSRLQKLAERIASLDALQSLAAISAERRFVRPTVTDGFDMFVEDGRHPVVEAVMDGAPFMANGTQLSKESQSMLLITGPNMAGKSTYMRQAALLCVMAQIGCFVPAKSATLPLVDRIFTRIGAADDLVGGQSTFMVEMKDIQVMTEKASSRSLVIIDELGRGTSTNEGMAIAQAVIEYVHDEIGCKALVSTHFHELSHLEQSLPSLSNACMAVREDGDNVTFLRKLVPGAASSSYGVYCARLAGLPDSIIGRAYSLLEEGDSTATLSENNARSPKAVQDGASAMMRTIEQEALHETAAAYDGLLETTEQQPTSAAVATEQTISGPIVQLSIFGDEPAAPAAPVENQQESNKRKLSPKAELVSERLRKLDVLNMTPMQALQWLNEMKMKLNDL